MELREYQKEAIESVWGWFNEGKSAPLIVTPTGSGKSVILASIIKQAIGWYPDLKILVVTHTKELVEQDFNAIKRWCYNADIGVYSAGLKKRQLKQVTVASIASIYKKKEFYGRFDIIIVDECHLIPHKSDGMYRKLLDESAAINSDLKLIGLTATPYRLDSGSLYEGRGALFDGISYQASVKELIAQGFLSNLTARTGEEADLSGIKKTGGDFNLGELGERMSAISLVNHHADIIVGKCKERKSWLIFAVTIEHAKRVKEALEERGVVAEYISGEMAAGDRDERIKAFKDGEIQSLVNCSILTTGFDYPALDCIVMLRPTMSPGLYVQMVGRGLRIHETKKDCLVLDFGGNVRRHGFFDDVKIKKGGRKGAAGEAPVKECENCNALVHIGAKECPECGFLFEIKERESEKDYHQGAVLSGQKEPEWLDVDAVSYRKHTGKSGVPTLQVSYRCGLLVIKEWVCIEHSGYARDKAAKWVVNRFVGVLEANQMNAIPRTVDDLLKTSTILRRPHRILVDASEKFPKILKYDFNPLTKVERANSVQSSNDIPF